MNPRSGENPGIRIIPAWHGHLSLVYTFFLKCITIHHLKFWPWGTFHFPLTLWPLQSRDPSLPSLPSLSGPQGRIFHTSHTRPTKRPKDALLLLDFTDFNQRFCTIKAIKAIEPIESRLSSRVHQKIVHNEGRVWG